MAVLLVAVQVAVAQSTWIVDSLQRPGFHFSDLPAAVAAAAPGDRIFLRFASTDPFLGYTAASIQGKGLSIQGEVGPGVPAVYVVGAWTLSSIPAGQSLVMRDLSLRGDVWSSRGFRWSATGCAGALVFERVTFGPQDQLGINPFLPENNDSVWRDCSLAVFRQCDINTGNWRWGAVRSSMTLTGCTLRQDANQYRGWGSIVIPATMLLDSSHLTLTSSTAEGGNAYFYSQTGQILGGSEAIRLRNSSTIVMGAGSIIRGGLDGFGGRTRWTMDDNLSTAPSTLWRDASCQLIGMQGFCCYLEYMQPQTGILPSESPGQIQIQQVTEPSAPTILLLAPLQTTPWNFVIGPVFLDPANLWSDLAVAPASGVLTRTLLIPPTIPPGQWVGAQAFSLDGTGRIMASNVTTVGVW